MPKIARGRGTGASSVTSASAYGSPSAWSWSSVARRSTTVSRFMTNEMISSSRTWPARGRSVPGGRKVVSRIRARLRVRARQRTGTAYVTLDAPTSALPLNATRRRSERRPPTRERRTRSRLANVQVRGRPSAASVRSRRRPRGRLTVSTRRPRQAVAGVSPVGGRSEPATSRITKPPCLRATPPATGGCERTGKPNSGSARRRAGVTTTAGGRERAAAVAGGGGGGGPVGGGGGAGAAGAEGGGGWPPGRRRRGPPRAPAAGALARPPRRRFGAAAPRGGPGAKFGPPIAWAITPADPTATTVP